MMNWEDAPDYAALWLHSCTRIGYQTFQSWMRYKHPGVEITVGMADRAQQMHEALLEKGMETIIREAGEQGEGGKEEK